MRLTKSMKIIKLLILAAVLTTFAAFGFGLASAQDQTQKDSSILLQPNFQELPLNAEFTVDVLVQTEDQLVGADLKIKFDKNTLEVVSIDQGETFDQIPLKVVGDGTVDITVVSTPPKKFTGEGRLVSLKLRAKDAGDTKIEFIFTAKSTTDSNLSNTGVGDSLTKVDSGHYVIGTAAQRGAASLRRSIVQLISILVFFIIAAVLGYLFYRRYKASREKPPDVFYPEEVPMDRPPENQ